MALENSSGNYLRIINNGVHTDGLQVETELWKDEATRNTPTEFDQTIRKTYDVAGIIDVNASADASKTIEQNLVTAGYEALKQLDELAAFDTDV